MNKEDTKAAIKVMQAYVDGKVIMYDNSASRNCYSVTENPFWCWSGRITEYCVKPVKPHVGPLRINRYDHLCETLTPQAVELTPEVIAALKAAGVEYDD